MDISSIIITILTFGLIIFVHELGHLLVAKKYGVYCHEFAIGMGPKLYSKQYGETLYSVRAIPIGGFVSLAGEEDDGEDVPEGRRLNEIGKLKQAAIMFAGAFFNFLLGFIIILGINTYLGEVENVPVVGQVVADSPAEEYGLEPGYKIVEVNGHEIVEFDAMAEYVNSGKADGYLNIIFEKDGKTIEITETEIDEDYMLGIVYDSVTVSRNPFLIFKNSVIGFFQMVTAMIAGFVSLFANFSNMKGSVGGPIMIAGVVDEYVQVGFIYLLNLVAVLSINIGIVNLLPIPGLDGSKIIIAIGEFITKRDLPRNLYIGLSVGGVLFLLLLMVIITVKDIVGLF